MTPLPHPPGAHVVAPSDMMDGRVGAIKAALAEAGVASKVWIIGNLN